MSIIKVCIGTNNVPETNAILDILACLSVDTAADEQLVIAEPASSTFIWTALLLPAGQVFIYASITGNRESLS
jgi:hypothetical protein